MLRNYHNTNTRMDSEDSYISGGYNKSSLG